MEKTCLIIDDENQKPIFDAKIKDVLKKKGIDAKLIYINASSHEVRNDDLHIDLEKFENKIKEEIKGKSIDVIACDYNLADAASANKKMGTDIIEILRNHRKNTPIILYSGNYEVIIKDVFDSYKKEESTEEESVNKIKRLYNNNISEFLKRSTYPEKVNTILINPPLKTDQIILSELRNYGDYKFQDAYPKFEGKTLSNIADEIDKNSYDGKQFLDEIIQQITSYMIETNSHKQ
ncbi:MAG: hypothetical protein N4A74_12480 [Carboxylicivirga sp.]|jgi:hypothetical protein|nr:hypothetical protein [Carboxylicivirga sp.]